MFERRRYTKGERMIGDPKTKLPWPDGKRFAFTIFDDTDYSTVENVGEVYAFLRDLGFRTTKSVWPLEGEQTPIAGGDTCENPKYLDWVLSLRDDGFEIGYHNATYHTSDRETSRRGLERFAELFSENPAVMANHVGCEEGMYWGESRLEGPTRFAFNLMTRGRRVGQHRGHVEGDRLFWGDLCRDRIRYVRNFVFRDINTFKKCPWMPYHDPRKPFVKNWFASSNGSGIKRFLETVSEESIERLEREGGACIMYTHLAAGFSQDGKPTARFRNVMERLASRDGWFVPVSTLLDWIRKTRGETVLTDVNRFRLELRWIADKAFIGTN